MALKLVTILCSVQTVDEIDEEVKMDILIDMAEIENQVASGGNDRLQTSALVACFHKAAKALWQM